MLVVPNSFLCLQVYRAVNYYYMVESRTVWPNLWRVVNLIHILLILAHWFGCFYFLLSEAEGFQVRQFTAATTTITIKPLSFCVGRLGLPLPPRRLRNANSKVPGLPLLVHADTDHHRRSSDARDQRRVSSDFSRLFKWSQRHSITVKTCHCGIRAYTQESDSADRSSPLREIFRVIEIVTA